MFRMPTCDLSLFTEAEAEIIKAVANNIINPWIKELFLTTAENYSENSFFNHLCNSGEKINSIEILYGPVLTEDMNEMQTRMEQMARVIHNKVGKGMRLGIMFLGMIPATVLGLVACDEHRDFPDTGMKVGHILCTDGKVMSYEDYSLSG